MSRARLWIAAAVAVPVVAAGCGGTESTGAGGAELVPAGVPAFIAIDSNPDSSQWQTVDELASKFPDKQKGIREIKKSMREDGLDWDHDVKPALGPEADVVWLDFQNGGENVVFLIQPDDEDAFARAVKKGNAAEENPEDRIVYEKFHGWTVMSDKQALIDRFESMSDQADEALQDDPAFRKAMDALPDDALTRAYVDGRKVMAQIDQAVDPEDRKFVRQLGSLDWAAASLAAQSDGVSFDVSVHGTPGALFGKGTKLRQFEAKLPEHVPKDAIFYYTFHGTKGLLSSLEKNPTFGAQLGPVMDVLKDIGALLEGEDALYVRPAKSSRFPEVTLVAEPRKGVSGRATLDRIITRYSSDLGVFPKPSMVAGSPASTLDFGPVRVHYADVGGKLVVTDLPSGIAGVKNPGKPLSENTTYKETLDAAGMPSKTHGFVYVDVRAGTGLVEKLSGTQLPPEVGRNLKPLRSALEYAVSRQHQLSVRVFVRIK